MSIDMARFTYDSDTDRIRAALIDDAIDDLTLDQIDEIVTARWDSFKILAGEYLAKRWSNASDVWEEAAERGWFVEED